MESIGINTGVLFLSNYRKGNPTLICGMGRGGTSAMAQCFVSSPNAKFVTDNPNGANLEICHINKAISENDFLSLYEFRKKTSEEYADNFFCKIPCFEQLGKHKPEFQKSWHNGNLIVMTRDAVALMLREMSLLETDYDAADELIKAQSRNQSSYLGAIECAKTMGVAMVSYEKLITSTSFVVKQMNDWFCEKILDTEKATDAIKPNNENYIRLQTDGILRKKLSN